MAGAKKRRGKRKTSAWSQGLVRNSQGLTFKEVARAQLRLINSKRSRLPKCNAIAKSTGERCGQRAMENGSCRFHGGLTPRGDNWHVRQLPTSRSKGALVRWNAKLAKAEKTDKARRQRLRIATDAEREAYEKWLWARPAGGAAKRAARRADARMKRRIAEETCELAEAAKVETAKPELLAIRARTEKLRELTALLNAARTGVFA